MQYFLAPQAKQGSTGKKKILMGLIDSYHQEAVELLLHNGGTETYILHLDIQFGHLLSTVLYNSDDNWASEADAT